MKRVELYSGPAAERMDNAENAPAAVLSDAEIEEFTTAYKENFKRFVGRARRRGARDPEAIAQTAFSKAFERWNTFEDRGKGRGPWLERILTNTALDEIRGTKRHPEKLVSELFEGEEHAAFESTADPADTALDEIEQSDRLAQIKELLADSPDNWYPIVELLAAGYRSVEIGEILSIDPQTVRTSVHRIRKIFRADPAFMAGISNRN